MVLQVAALEIPEVLELMAQLVIRAHLVMVLRAEERAIPEVEVLLEARVMLVLLAQAVR
jgi:hypothetical protein